MTITESPKIGLTRTGGIVIGRNLTTEEYEMYCSARNRISRFESDQEMLNIFVMNYIDFQDHMKQVPGVSYDAVIAFKTEANRRILNMLSTFRSFLDHAETKLKRRYGANSEQFKNFRAACTHHYDNDFSYRFLYRLRNYIQHCGMPVGQVEYHARLVDLQEKTAEMTVNVTFSRDSLLQEFDGWGPLRQELKQLSPQIAMDPHFEVLVSCVQQISGVVMEGEWDELERCAEAISVLTDRLEGLGHPTIFTGLRNSQGAPVSTATDFMNAKGTINWQMERMPILHVNRVDKLVQIVR